jgi:MFS family permease
MDGPSVTVSGRRAERRYQLEVRRHLNRNFSAQLVHGMLGQTGFRLLNAPTFLPAYVLLLSSGSDVAVGLALSLQAAGQMITPLIGANLIAHRARVLPVGFVTGGAMRAMVLCIGLAGLLLAPPLALVAIMVFLALFGLFSGMQGVIFNFLMSKVIPVNKRGRLTGLRNFLAGIISAAVAWAAGHWFLGATPTAAGYSWTFLLAFLLTTIGLLCLIPMIEPEPPTRRAKQGLGQSLRDIGPLLRADAPFRNYVAARAVATLGRLAMPFYILHAGQSLGLDGPTLGLLTIAFTLAGTVSNLAWGPLGDRRGFRLSFLVAIALWVASTLLLMVGGSSLWAALIVFAGIGAAVQGFQNSSVNLSLEFGDRHDLPARIAIANTASEGAGTVGPVLGGLLAAAFGYQSVFIASMAFLMMGGAVIALYVPEPRHARAPGTRPGTGRPT